MADDGLLTVKQIARELGLANTRVMSLIRRGHIVAASRPAGPATWRVSRKSLDEYLDRQRTEERELAVRRRQKRLKALTTAWRNLNEDEIQQLRRELPADLFRPLVRLTDPKSNTQSSDIDALSHAYRRRTEAGIEELALSMPHDLFWAVARIN